MSNDPNSQPKSISFGTKIRYTFYASVLFFFLSTPFVHDILGKLFNSDFELVDVDGQQTLKGMATTTGIFWRRISPSNCGTSCPFQAKRYKADCFKKGKHITNAIFLCIPARFVITKKEYSGSDKKIYQRG